MSEIYQSEQTEDKPAVNFNLNSGVLEIEGKSLPENASDFYNPIIEWVSNYVKQPNKSTNLVCKIDYFNSSSARKFYDIFKELEKIKDSGNNVKITWYHDPEDKLMETKGREFQSVVKIPFDIQTM